jgi:uncharacterized protein
MDRLFLDAHVLFSAAYRANAGLLQCWKLKNVTLCSSRYALEEARINLGDEAQRRRLTKLAGSLALFEATARPFPGRIAQPEKDRDGSESDASDYGRRAAFRSVSQQDD